MKEIAILKSERFSGFKFNFILFGGIFFLFIAFISAKDNLITSTLFIISSIVFFYFLLFIDEIEIYNDRIEVRKKFKKNKKVIFLRDILSWSEHTIESRYSKGFHVLTIKTIDTIYKIEASNYDNYYLLKKYIIENRIQGKNGQEIYKYHKDKRESILLIIFGFFLIALTVYLFLPDKINANNLIEVYNKNSSNILCLLFFIVLTIAIGVWTFPKNKANA